MQWVPVYALTAGAAEAAPRCLAGPRRNGKKGAGRKPVEETLTRAHEIASEAAQPEVWRLLEFWRQTFGFSKLWKHVEALCTQEAAEEDDVTASPAYVDFAFGWRRALALADEDCRQASAIRGRRGSQRGAVTISQRSIAAVPKPT